MQSIPFHQLKQAQEHWTRSLIYFSQTVLFWNAYKWDSRISAEILCKALQGPGRWRALGTASMDVASVNNTWPTWLPLMFKWVDLWTSRGRAVAAIDGNFNKRFGTGSHIILVCKLGYYSLENQMSKIQFYG